MALEFSDARRFQPHPLFCFFHTHCGYRDFKRCTAFDNRMDNGLTWPAFVYVLNKVAVDLDTIGLELREQLQAGKPSAKVIDGDTDSCSFQRSYRPAEGIELRNGLVFRKLDDDLLWDEVILGDRLEQNIDRIWHVDQGHWQDID